MRNKQALADAARTTPTRRKDLWPTQVGPNVMAWSYVDNDPDCDTVYTVFCATPGGKPHLQLAYSTGTYSQVPITHPERFGKWHNRKEFRDWAQAWKKAGDP